MLPQLITCKQLYLEMWSMVEAENHVGTFFVASRIEQLEITERTMNPKKRKSRKYTG